LTHNLLGGFVDSSSSSDALGVFPKVTIFGGSGRESAAKGMTVVSWLLEQADAMLELASLESSKEEEVEASEPPKKELKPLLDNLKYKFLGLAKSLPMIIASELVDTQEEKLLDVLREHKEAIG
jgi:hypothetical protein